MAFSRLLALLAIGAAIHVATPGNAVPLLPGGVIFPTGTTSAADPDLLAVVVNDNLLNFRIDPTPVTPFTDTGGSVQNRVAVSNNLGTLIFGPRIRDTFNIDTGTLAIIATELTGYGTFATDVDFRTDGLGDKGFTSVSRSGSGDVLTFRYDDPLLVDAFNPPGRQQESLFPSIKTDALAFDSIGRVTIFAQLTDGNDNPVGDLFTVSVGGLAVPVPVPLPATIMLLLGGLGLLGAIPPRRR